MSSCLVNMSNGDVPGASLRHQAATSRVCSKYSPVSILKLGGVRDVHALSTILQEKRCCITLLLNVADGVPSKLRAS